MKLLLVISHFRASTGGAEAFAVMVMKRLAARGHRIRVVADDGESVPGVELVCDSMRAASAQETAFHPDLVLDWGLNVQAGVHRLGGGTHREFQRIVLESYPLPKRLLKRLSYLLSPHHRRTTAHERRLLMQPGTHFIAVSNFVKQQILCTAPVDENRIHVLHNGVDIERFHPDWPADRRNTTRAELGLAPDDIAFLLVAHNLKLKNIALLGRIFPHIHRVRPNAKLVVLSRRNPGFAAPWAIYAPSTEEPEQIYAAADALVHPTFYDACANVVLEALASGLPVISSDRNGSAELLRHTENGFVLPVVPPGKPTAAAWSRSIATLAEKADLRRTLGNAARETALGHSVETYIDTLEACLEHIAGANRG